MKQKKENFVETIAPLIEEPETELYKYLIKRHELEKILATEKLISLLVLFATAMIGLILLGLR